MNNPITISYVTELTFSFPQLRRKIFSLILLLLSCNSLFSQSMAEKYYALVRDADSCVINGNLETANKVYQTVIDDYGIQKMMSVDMFNLFVVKLELEKYKEAYPLIRELKARGWEPDAYHEYISAQYSDREAILNTMFDTIVVKPLLDTFNQIVHETLETIVGIDQTLNKLLYVDEEDSIKKDYRSLLTSINLDNMSALIKLLSSEYYNNNLLIHSGGKPNRFPVYNIIYTHALQLDNSSFDFTPLYEQVERLNYYPDLLGQMMSNQMISDGKFENFLDGDSILTPVYHVEFVQSQGMGRQPDTLFTLRHPIEPGHEVNEVVKRFPCFTSTDDMIRKAKFQYETPGKYFHYFFRINVPVVAISSLRRVYEMEYLSTK